MAEEHLKTLETARERKLASELKGAVVADAWHKPYGEGDKQRLATESA